MYLLVSAQMATSFIATLLWHIFWPSLMYVFAGRCTGSNITHSHTPLMYVLTRSDSMYLLVGEQHHSYPYSFDICFGQVWQCVFAGRCAGCCVQRCRPAGSCWVMWGRPLCLSYAVLHSSTITSLEWWPLSLCMVGGRFLSSPLLGNSGDVLALMLRASSAWLLFPWDLPIVDHS